MSDPNEVDPCGVLQCPKCGGPFMVESEREVWTLCNCRLTEAEYDAAIAEARWQNIQRCARVLD